MCDSANDSIAASTVRHNHHNVLNLFLGLTVLVLIHHRRSLRNKVCWMWVVPVPIDHFLQTSAEALMHARPFLTKNTSVTKSKWLPHGIPLVVHDHTLVPSVSHDPVWDLAGTGHRVVWSRLDVSSLRPGLTL